MRFRRKTVAAQRSSSRRFVVFNAGGKEFGVDIGKVKEAIRLGKVLSVPKAPAWIVGIMDLRGRVVPIVDLAGRLELGSAAKGEVPAKGILVSVGGQTVGLGVDDVHEVIELPESAISLPNRLLSGGVGDSFLEGVGQTVGGLLLLLDVERLFSATERDTLSLVGGSGTEQG